MPNEVKISSLGPTCCDELETLKNAVASDHHSRAAYVGRVTQIERVTVFDETGQPFEKDVPFVISWSSISEILSLIRKRAKLNP